MCKQLDYWYYNKFRFWRFRPAFRLFLQRLRFPLIPPHSSTWEKGDHAHVCLAAHLLEEDDFRAVCPHKDRIAVPGLEDECDLCKYLIVVSFLKNDNGEKKIDLEVHRSSCDKYGRCDVCGKYGRLSVACSSCGAETFAYCNECMECGAEPWGSLVAYISCVGRYPDSINEEYREIVRRTCERLGKTEAEFAAAVDAELEAEREIPGQMDIWEE